MRIVDNVLAAFLLIFLVFSTPIFLILDGPIANSIIAAISAGALAAAAASLRPQATAHLLKLIRPIALVASLPAVWMIIQILPLGVLPNPAWESAGVALGHATGGEISVDLGGTARALANYLVIVAIMLASIVVTSDRRRAEWILFALSAVTALIAALAAGRDIVRSGSIRDLEAISTWPDCMALGVLLSVAVLAQTIESHQSHRRTPDWRALMLDSKFLAALCAFAICAIAIAFQVSLNLICAVALGLATLITLVLVRRFVLGPWETSAALISCILIAIAVFTLRPSIVATNVPRSVASVSERMLADSGWSGWGAGTFATLIPIYRATEEGPTIVPSSAATLIAIELGRPTLWASVAAMMIGITALVKGALSRGRDTFYPAAGAACIVTLLILAFSNSGVLSLPVAIIAATTLGLAFSQSKSRTLQPNE
jgi:hypothetical protein